MPLGYLLADAVVFGVNLLPAFGRPRRRGPAGAGRRAGGGAAPVLVRQRGHTEQS